MVDRVGARIANVDTKNYNGKRQGSVLEGYEWEFTTIASDDVNAWCMSGGKVVIYTGLFPVSQNVTTLAIVMGHEIAHAIPKQGGERMSRAMMQQLRGAALEVAL